MAMKISRRLIGITSMSDIVERRIPVLTLDSREPGPTIWLTACIHGDEAGGAVIVHEVFKALRESGMRFGTLHAFPLINSMGFENISRFINADREDLNRCFPGRSDGTMGEQIARRLFDSITKSKPDLVIDLHNDWIHSVPYILLEPPACYATSKLQQRSLRLARATGLLLVQDTMSPVEMHRTLTGALVSAGIPAFTMEAGGAYGIVEESVNAGKLAVLSVLSELGLIDRPAAASKSRAEAGLLRYTNRPLCSSSGLVRFAVSPGDRVKTNQLLAQVYSAFGSCEETLRAEAPGYVLGLADHARVVPGGEVIAIAESAERLA